jgi:hypothetical protein
VEGGARACSSRSWFAGKDASCPIFSFVLLLYSVPTFGPARMTNDAVLRQMRCDSCVRYIILLGRRKTDSKAKSQKPLGTDRPDALYDTRRCPPEELSRLRYLPLRVE